jgi:hypothetical protein
MNINSDVLPELTWASRLGAFSPRAVSFPGMSVPVAATGTGPCAVVVRAVQRVRDKVSFVALPTQPEVPAALLGQTNIHNCMTRAYTFGEGASGPPPEREPV